MTTVAAAPCVAIIGSFRQHYDQIVEACMAFRDAGVIVTSPLATSILEEGIPFVRFESDPPDWDDPTVQTVALHRILRADAVYVVAPGGYVGRTTCYEIGRALHARRPVYFSEVPQDLPVLIRHTHVASPATVASYILGGEVAPNFSDDSEHSSLERRLQIGEYVDY